jgi:hypothetical protein
METEHVTVEDVVKVARQAGPEALAALWDREVDRARRAITILSYLSAYGRTTKFADKDFDLERFSILLTTPSRN